MLPLHHKTAICRHISTFASAASYNVGVEASTEILLRRVEDALRTGWHDERVIPLLAQLGQIAESGSTAWLLAHRELATRVVADDPWQAALLMRRAVEQCADDDACWGLLGLAQSLLGHHRYAIRAYRRALAQSPNNPRYALNLGHLIDVVLDRPHDALRLLRSASQRLPQNADVTASYAHALARAGHLGHARDVMRAVVQGRASAEHHELYSWIVGLCHGAALNEKRQPSESAPGRRFRKRRFTSA